MVARPSSVVYLAPALVGSSNPGIPCVGFRRTQSRSDDATNWVIAPTVEAAKALASEKKGVPQDKIVLEQDPDVLDTWFSSGLFPFSVMGWPKTTDDMRAFFPGSLLETGRDILFFW